MNLWSLFISFFKIGLFGFGGGIAMLPFIFQAAQLLAKMDEEEFSNLVVLSQITPGPLAVNAATYVGFSYAGLLGALLATFAVSVPAFALVLAFSTVLDKHRESRLREAVFCGIRPATAGLVAAAALLISRSSLFKPELLESMKKGFSLKSLKFFIDNPFEAFDCFSFGIFLLSVLLVLKFKISPIKVIAVVIAISLGFSFI